MSWVGLVTARILLTSLLQTSQKLTRKNSSACKRRDFREQKLSDTSLFFSHQLPSEEEAEAGPQVSTDAPPPYSSITADNAGMEFS